MLTEVPCCAHFRFSSWRLSWRRSPWAATISGPAPNFTLQSRDGKHVSLGRSQRPSRHGEFLGHVVPAVPAGDAALEALYKRYNSLGFTLLGRERGETTPKAREVARGERPVTFPVLFDPKNEVSKLYKVVAMPSTVLVGTRRHDAFHSPRLQAGVRGRVPEPRFARCCGSSAMTATKRRRSFACALAAASAAARSPVAASSRG